MNRKTKSTSTYKTKKARNIAVKSKSAGKAAKKPAKSC